MGRHCSIAQQCQGQADRCRTVGVNVLGIGAGAKPMAAVEIPGQNEMIRSKLEDVA